MKNLFARSTDSARAWNLPDSREFIYNVRAAWLEIPSHSIFELYHLDIEHNPFSRGPLYRLRGNKVENGLPPGEGLCQSIVLSVAEAEGVQPNDLPPLGSDVAIDAMETFLQSSDRRSAAEFRYLGRRIRVKNDGSIFMSKPDSEQDRFVARCNSCDKEKRDVGLETAQDFFADHADQRHEVEIERIGEVEPQLSEEKEEGTD